MRQSKALLHKPVLLKEVLQCLDLKAGMTVLDGTVGSGGHARGILDQIGSQGKLIGLDLDPSAIERTKATLKSFPNAVFIQGNYKDAGDYLDRLNTEAVDAVLLDVGFSSDQLEDYSRGFSYDHDGPLDMRLDPGRETTAGKLIQELSPERLEKVFKEFGEERFARRYAQAIVFAREKEKIGTTHKLVEIMRRSAPVRCRGTQHRIAARVFQALRIAVNNELENLRDGLQNIWKKVRTQGRIAVISFHSMEDRIVKRFFSEKVLSKEAALVHKKPLVASWDEVKVNRRARSAKLRAAEKII